MNRKIIRKTNFWADKRVLVTGNTGFKGSWLCLWLTQMGAYVIGVSIGPPSQKNLWDLANINELVDDHEIDIRNLERLTKVFNQTKPDVVFHMAAQTAVLVSHKHPVDTFSTNIMGTVNVLEAARHCSSVKAIVNVTSDKCYQNREWQWGYREDEALGGTDPYSSSKACSEMVTAAYRASYFSHGESEQNIALATARAGNVIGGGDWTENRIVPDSIDALINAIPIAVRNPDSIRPWQHVLEPLSGYLVLAELLYEKGETYARAWNFGPLEQDTKDVAFIVEQLVQCWGDGATWITQKTELPREAGILKIDSSLATSHLNWTPRLSLDEAVQWTVNWSKDQNRGVSARKLTLDQISMYEGKGI